MRNDIRIGDRLDGVYIGDNLDGKGGGIDMDDKYTFEGWWEEAEKNYAAEPWETWSIRLYGNEAGDSVDTAVDIDKVLAASGYEIILRKLPDAGAQNRSQTHTANGEQR